MARPVKQGLDYFPLDVGFLQDIKTRRIMKACGTQSIPILISLLGSIYRDAGYYTEWNNDMPFLIADEVGVSEGAVMETVTKAVQVDFFNSVIWTNYSILTSAGIQRRFFEAVSRRNEVRVRRDILLIDVSVYRNLVNVDNNSVNVCNNSVNVDRNEQRKEKESKEKQRKEKETPPAEDASEISRKVHDARITLTGGIGPVQYAQLTELIRLHGEARVLEAMSIAASRGVRSLEYARGILQRWKRDGYDGNHEGGGHSGGNPEKRDSRADRLEQYRNIKGL